MNKHQPLQACSYHQQQHMPIPVRNNGDEECDDEDIVVGMNGFEQTHFGQLNSNGNGGCGGVTVAAAGSSRMSELTIAFEGEVYVFPAVTPEKVQAVLLLLGGRDISSSITSSEFLLQQNGVVDTSRGSKISRRMASLVRFREKRKERCYEKKIRYSCRKEVAQRMHRKNGQFASVKDCFQAGEGNGDSSDGTSQQELRRCQHCGINEKLTPAMRRGPAGPRTLCNACGLMWANKGTLRDLSKGGRIIPNDHTEPVTPSDIKPLGMEMENSYHHQDEQGSSEETKPEQLNSNNHVRSDAQNMLENAPTDGHPLPIQVNHSSVNLDEEDLQGALDQFANASASEFELPANFDEQVAMDHSNLGTDWPGT